MLKPSHNKKVIAAAFPEGEHVREHALYLFTCIEYVAGVRQNNTIFASSNRDRSIARFDSCATLRGKLCADQSPIPRTYVLVIYSNLSKLVTRYLTITNQP